MLGGKWLYRKRYCGIFERMKTLSTSAMATWILLLAWLFCGSVAFAEQVEVPVQTNEQESQACEEALQGVGHALKPATNGETCLAPPDFSIFTWAILQHISIISINRSPIFRASWPRPLTPLTADTASLLCTYRI